MYGAFPEYKSFAGIIEMEYERWLSTDEAQKQKLVKLVQKRGGVLTLEDWIVAVTSWGLPADKIGEFSGLKVRAYLFATPVHPPTRLVCLILRVHQRPRGCMCVPLSACICV